MWPAPSSVDDVVVLNGGDPILVEQLTELRSLKTREAVVAKGDGTGASALTLGRGGVVGIGCVGQGEGR